LKGLLVTQVGGKLAEKVEVMPDTRGGLCTKKVPTNALHSWKLELVVKSRSNARHQRWTLYQKSTNQRIGWKLELVEKVEVMPDTRDDFCTKKVATIASTGTLQRGRKGKYYKNTNVTIT
jgi:hypothetical protein